MLCGKQRKFIEGWNLLGTFGACKGLLSAKEIARISDNYIKCILRFPDLWADGARLQSGKQARLGRRGIGLKAKVVCRLCETTKESDKPSRSKRLQETFCLSRYNAMWLASTHENTHAHAHQHAHIHEDTCTQARRALAQIRRHTCLPTNAARHDNRCTLLLKCVCCEMHAHLMCVQFKIGTVTCFHAVRCRSVTISCKHTRTWRGSYPCLSEEQ